MSKGGIIEIDDMKVEVFLNTKAMIDIKEESGRPFEELKDWFLEEKEVTEQLRKVAHIIGHLANGAIFKHNSAIKAGLKNGEIKPFYDLDIFIGILDPFQLKYYFNVIFECINTGTVVSVPGNVKFNEVDEVLEEIEEEKNQKGGDAETTVE